MENVFSMMKNFSSVRIGALRPTASMIVVITSNTSKAFDSSGKYPLMP
jgi:hypothetical protein